ncbi:DNA gyrase/topoisomerase IV subunit A [Williamwhitmania taraxaci]|uniref:DNA topoisomerase IV subunit A n=1 Tax=Williamwhitmania taraxaci TaxID=1640674 RepID=A0A1G6I4Q2_9BACT|nr:DNA gyrase/topoisomerase IV subunit A [Williamwhitmania taraxaci]SDC01035.1 DNA topoisomerase IV subunit A [Williamwhitmania taraxaci]
MSAEDLDKPEELDDINELPVEGSADKEKLAKLIGDGVKKKFLSGMYKDWFLDYASYVILERAVPHIYDGLKPVHRRILHAMKRLDDGRFNKVANIIGYTMQYHPHGDASIGDALVQLGQKDLLVECQGNWGNVLTGDNAAAPRYIEARLSKFANDVVFNPKTTEWMRSYDGRNQEPVTLPVKFPLLLVQGVEGIAVGLASKILPHNFIELIDASIAYLKNQDFELYPDFITGGMADCSRYNDGLRGGAIKVRARINKIDKKTLVITEIPFGKNTATLIESILKANDKGKIKIRKIDDNTARNVEILIHLPADTSPDKTIDALYAFTDCEISISPNSCVIEDDRPRFVGVKEMLRISADKTMALLKLELQIKLAELLEDWHFSSLEKIFFEEKIYRELEKNTDTWDQILVGIERGFDPYRAKFRREIVRTDIEKLTEKPVRKISKFDIKKADELIKGIEAEMLTVQHNLDNLVAYTITYYEQIKKKHSKGRERKTELRSFEAIQATQVVVANQKLYVNREEGFFGTGLKKDEYVADCSDIDDVIVFLKSGKYTIAKVADKSFFGKDIIHIGVFKRNDTRTIYNAVYRDGRNGSIMIKRCAITGITRDKEYDISKGTDGSQVLYMSVNPNGEAEVLKVFLKPRPKLKKPIIDLDFSTLAIKGRSSMGNIFSRYAIHKIQVKEKGVSTLGGQKIWFDADVLRLNADGRGKLLGEFGANDKLVVFYKRGIYSITSYETSNHYDDDLLLIEKFDAVKVYSVLFFDAEQSFVYLKRFSVEVIDKPQSFIGDASGSYLVEFSTDAWPQVEIVFGGSYAHRLNELVDVSEFIGVKSFRARGKRLTPYQIGEAKFVEPLQKEEPLDESAEEPMEQDPSDSGDESDSDSDSDGETTQMSLEI